MYLTSAGQSIGVKCIIDRYNSTNPRLPEQILSVQFSFEAAADYLFVLKVGYEPLPPTLGRNIFGRQVYQLPGLFAYGKYIT